MKRFLKKFNYVDMTDRKETTLKVFKIQNSCCKFMQAYFGHTQSAISLPFLPIAHILPSPALAWISSSNLSPTSLESLRLFRLPESGGGPRTLDPKAIWQTS